MCGISGSITNNPLEPDFIKRIHRIQLHRGPDGNGETWYDAQNFQSVTLLHQRLAIVDVKHGVQPMEDVDGKLSIVFNGEIFNHEKLKELLLGKGYVFKTDHSDTEVLLCAYKEYGAEMLNMLNGMFAFVIYDKGKQELFAARDRVGIKPLYYASVNDEFFFASELKTLLLGYGIEREIDRQSFVNYLSYQFIPAPRTIIKGVNKLQAAHYLIYDIRTSKTTVQKYWDISFSAIKPCKGDVYKRIFDQVKKSVKLWSRGDVDASVSLSGGLDSSIIASLMSKENQFKVGVKSFSLGFEQQDLSIDELPIARTVADQIGSEHYECLISSDNVIKELDKMVYHLDEPYGGGVPSWFVYQLMNGKTKVTLTGTGGDELFGNYRKFLIYESSLFKKAFFLYRHCSRSFLRCIKSFILYPNAFFYHKFFNFSDIKKLVIDCDDVDSPDLILEKNIKNSDTKDPRNFVPYVDFKMQLPEEFLHVTDRFSMAFSIEARTPFLDHELINLIMHLSTEVRTKASDPKYLLKDIFSTILPKEVLNSPKRGFIVPKSQWIREELKDLLDDLFSSDFIREQGIFNSNIYDVYIRPHMLEECDNGEKIWTLLMFQLWYKNFILEGGYSKDAG